MEVSSLTTLNVLNMTENTEESPQRDFFFYYWVNTKAYACIFLLGEHLSPSFRAHLLFICRQL